MTANTQIDKQGDLYIKGNVECECAFKHVFTEYEIKEAIFQASRIMQLILDHGWDLTDNYYHYLYKIDDTCNAWDPKNKEYITLRNTFEKDIENITIPLNSPTRAQRHRRNDRYY